MLPPVAQTIWAALEERRARLSGRPAAPPASMKGPGIPAEFREKVFERFFRLEGRHGKPGTGIGLYLVRELVDAHGGSIEAHSEPGKGTRVCARKWV